MSSLMHRFLRVTVFAAGLAIGVGAAVFGYSNTEHLTLHWWTIRWLDVPLGGALVLALLIGLLAGYVYHLPARMHHFNEHMRHRSRVHELERENKDLRKTVDQLLELPDPGVETVPARKLTSLGGRTRVESGDEAAGSSEIAAMVAEPVIVHQVRPARRAGRSDPEPRAGAATEPAAEAVRSNGQAEAAASGKHAPRRAASAP